MIRCCPRVVPVFPPTGLTGVGSLNPTPAGSLLMIVTVAALSKDGVRARQAASAIPACRLLLFIGGALCLGSRLEVAGLPGDHPFGGLVACHTIHGNLTVGRPGCD